MKTVIGLFDRADEAKRAYSALVAEGYARADLDILTNDDKDDVPKLERMHSWVPQPDLDIYLSGVHDGGTIVTANVGNSAVTRAASILGSFDMVNISERANDLARKAISRNPEGTRSALGTATGVVGSAAATAADAGRSAIGKAADVGRAAVGTAGAAAAGAASKVVSGLSTPPPKQTPVPPKAIPTERGLSDPARNDNVLEVIEEDLSVGKEAVERGRMRIYNVVTEREVQQNVALRDETIRVQRRPVSRSVDIDEELFKPRSFEMVEIDEIAKVKKTARVVEEVTLGKDVVDKIQTIKETLRHQDVKVEEVPAARPFESYQNKAVVRYAWETVRTAR